MREDQSSPVRRSSSSSDAPASASWTARTPLPYRSIRSCRSAASTPAMLAAASLPSRRETVAEGADPLGGELDLGARPESSGRIEVGAAERTQRERVAALQ